ncbi:sugar phosphate isomerase/epimerase [Alteromonas sp. C1M14]|uniref:sugar phosphate isomerase/epimerase family protein n=1 Tax=Alteromonas sp. C1M14 TaxID=2841567 RepID=UPI001C0996C8|nr:sugar phosphate isomerase/epimerase [Alteromonas sp. C1M14]MBU2978589.1 sugar phosphate isomerase/epimerase [Alteromonas sp. C1M14]
MGNKSIRLNSLSATQRHPIAKRRQFMKLGAAGLALAAFPSVGLAQAKREIRVGIQLYTLRDMMAENVPAVLKLVAAQGYKELEFAGYYGHSPRELRKIIDGEGLSAPSSHISLDALRRGGIHRLIDTAQEVGHKYLVIPYLTEAQRGSSIDVYKQLAEECNQWGEICNSEGLTLAYHNHYFEFQKVDGVEPYDILLNEVQEQNMTMEIDLYWMIKAQKDPISYFKKYPYRFKLWHVKDMDVDGQFADVGTGTINFASIFKNAKLAGAEHYFVERDTTDDAIQTLQQGFKAVSALLK